MKKKLPALVLLILPLLCTSQTVSTVTHGGFSDPATWDCSCVPSSNDTLIVHHQVLLNVDLNQSSGKIVVQPGGVIYLGTTQHTIQLNGTSSLHNMGTLMANAMIIAPGATLINDLKITNVDSLWNEGTIENSGHIALYNMWNTETGSVDNPGRIDVFNNLYNLGYYYNPGIVFLINDFSNCHGQNTSAMFRNDGYCCIGNNFTNCSNDTISGTGEYSVGGASNNMGVLAGSHLFKTPSGFLDVSGTIEETVTVIAGYCTLDVAGKAKEKAEVYPNPAQQKLLVNGEFSTYLIRSAYGKEVQSGIISNKMVDVSKLQAGTYLLTLDGLHTIRIVKQ